MLNLNDMDHLDLEKLAEALRGEPEEDSPKDPEPVSTPPEPEQPVRTLRAENENLRQEMVRLLAERAEVRARLEYLQELEEEEEEEEEEDRQRGQRLRAWLRTLGLSLLLVPLGSVAWPVLELMVVGCRWIIGEPSILWALTASGLSLLVLSGDRRR